MSPSISRVVLLVTSCFLAASGCRTAAPPALPGDGTVAEASEAAPRGRPLFDGETLGQWEVSNYGFDHAVRVSDGAIVLGMTDMLSGVTYTGDLPRIDYEVTLEAQRVMGGDFFVGLTFPVGDDPCTLIVGGWGGVVVGLSNIDGRDASENETRTLKGFENGRWYDVRLRVTQDSIRAWIDGENLVDFRHAGRALSIRPEVRPSVPFGLAAWQTKAAIREIYLRRLDD